MAHEHSRMRWMLIAALGAALFALGLAIGNRASQARTNADIAAIRAAIAALEEEAQGGPRSQSSAAFERMRSAALQSRHSVRPPFAAEAPPTPEQGLLDVSVEKRQLDTAFASERLDPAWSGQATSLVQDALVNVAAQPGFPIPEESRIECRSESCRIALSLADSGEAGQISDSLLADIATMLPQAKLVELPSSDGDGIELYIYAMTLPGR